jgi:predicted phosphodiesterase
MKVINVDLANDIKTLELVCLSDTHIGDPFANEQALMKQIRYVEDTPNCYAILNGDLMNNGTKSSPTDTYTEAMSPLEQMIKAVTLLKPIADKVLAITQGNHERRTAKESGVDIARLIARELHLEERYSEGMAYIFLRFGDWGGGKHHQPVSYQILVTHGTGGGKTVGSKANRLADLVAIADADLYLYGHTHQSMAYREGFYRVNQQKNLVTLVDRLFVNSGAFLDWGGYAEQAQFRPAIISTPHIFLDGTDRKMWVQM